MRRLLGCRGINGLAGNDDAHNETPTDSAGRITHWLPYSANILDTCAASNGPAGLLMTKPRAAKLGADLAQRVVRCLRSLSLSAPTLVALDVRM